MFEPIVSAYLFVALAAVVVFFQLAMVLGAPWGEVSAGGKFPGRFPPKMRMAAFVQMLLFVAMAVLVLTRAGLVFGDHLEFSQSAIWFVVVYCLVGAVMNTITPNIRERMLWAPVTIGLLIFSFLVAMS